MPKKQRRQKHIPHRTCVGCRQVLPKRTLIRIVRSPDGVKIDPSGKMAGRGAYLHNHRTCWAKGLKGSLAQALKTTLTEEEMQLLTDYMTQLPTEDECVVEGQ